MGKILEFIQQHSAGKYFCYGSKKVSLDDNINDVLSFDDKTVSEAKKSVFAETDPTQVNSIRGLWYWEKSTEFRIWYS